MAPALNSHDADTGAFETELSNNSWLGANCSLLGCQQGRMKSVFQLLTSFQFRHLRLASPQARAGSLSSLLPLESDEEMREGQGRRHSAQWFRPQAPETGGAGFHIPEPERKPFVLRGCSDRAQRGAQNRCGNVPLRSEKQLPPGPASSQLCGLEDITVSDPFPFLPNE